MYKNYYKKAVLLASVWYDWFSSLGHDKTLTDFSTLFYTNKQGQTKESQQFV